MAEGDVTEGRAVRAWLGSLLFLVVAPGVVVGLVPWWLTQHWQSGRLVELLVFPGLLLLVICVVALLHSFVMFVVRGHGTPAPVAPTDRLVVEGLYRHVRNPMYVAVTGAVLGQAMVLGRPVLVGYAAGLWCLMAAFARFYEEPALRRRHGRAYDEYRARVRAWIPHLRPR